MDFATFAALSEVIIAIGVFYIVISNMRGRPFNGRLALGLILFEFFVNMVYMIVRMKDHTEIGEKEPWFVALAAIHGSLSLLIFISFAVLAALAYSESKKGDCYFAKRARLASIFLFFWLISVGSGEVLYFVK